MEREHSEEREIFTTDTGGRKQRQREKERGTESEGGGGEGGKKKKRYWESNMGNHFLKKDSP